MITEHALLPVIPGQEQPFELAIRKARPIIASTAGFRNLSLSRSTEFPNIYLLLVERDRFED